MVRGVASVGGGLHEWEVGSRQAGGSGEVTCLIGGELGQEVAKVGHVSRRWVQGRPGQRVSLENGLVGGEPCKQG